MLIFAYCTDGACNPNIIRDSGLPLRSGDKLIYGAGECCSASNQAATFEPHPSLDANIGDIERVPGVSLDVELFCVVGGNQESAMILRRPLCELRSLIGSAVVKSISNRYVGS
jgi:hypothetical protein